MVNSENKIKGLYNYLSYNKIKQVDVVRKTGYDKGNVSKIFNRILNPSDEFLQLFEVGFNVDLSKLSEVVIKRDTTSLHKKGYNSDFTTSNCINEPENIYNQPTNQLEEKERAIMFLERHIVDKEKLLLYKDKEIEKLEKELNAMKSRVSFAKKTH